MEELDLSEEKYLCEKLAGRLRKTFIDPSKGMYINQRQADLQSHVRIPNPVRDETYEEWANRLREQKNGR